MSTAHSRTALARAEFFLQLAEKCTPGQRAEFEAYVDASIIFARTALHRLKSKHNHHPSWETWFAQLKSNPAVEFFRENRDFLLKEGPTKIGQVISFNPVTSAAQLYFFDTPPAPATETLRKHLVSYAQTLQEGANIFNT